MTAPFIVSTLKATFHGKAAMAFICSLPVFTTISVIETFRGQVVLALIAAGPPTAAVIVAMIAMLRGQKAMHLQMNSRLDELLAAKQGVAKAEGVEQERQEARARASGEDKDAQKVEVINTPDSPVPTKPIK